MSISNFWSKFNLFWACLFYFNSIFAGQFIGKKLNLSEDQLKIYQHANIKVLGVIQIKGNIGKDDDLAEFSGLAWDQDQNQLYALSDRGYFIQLSPVFKGDDLINIELIGFHHLNDARGKNLKYKYSDSEGLALLNANNGIQNDTQLLVSFERVPRVARYSDEGDYLSDEPISNDLKNIQNFAGENKSLEAITTHNEFKIITGPERPLVNSKAHQLTLYSSDYRKWGFTPHNENFGSLVGLTTLPDGSLIALERIYPGIFAGITSVIHKIKLENNSLSQTELVSIQPSAGYFNENFEGITWYKDNRFFMISDDNDNFLQRSILVYFEILNLDEN